jgi:sugar phosphate isomerase/epimerase
MLYTRRELGRLALAALPASPFLLRSASLLAAGKPNSKFAGVQVGLNVPYNFGNNWMDGDETLARCLELGVSAVELRSQPVERFLGSPATPPAPGGSGGGRATPTPEQVTARKAAAEALRKWRVSVPMDKVKTFRKKYEDAGVRIEIVKFDGIYAMADDEIDYCFALASALGARAISCEISVDDTKRLGQFADKHKMMVGYHGHAAATPAMWETAFSYAKYNGANVDLGHFVAGMNTSPVPFIKQHHDRITHVHVKDRKFNNGPNVPFGQGDTPIKDVLQVIRDNKWPIQATIEFEYPVPPGSDRMAEMAKCIKYCQDALM